MTNQKRSTKNTNVRPVSTVQLVAVTGGSKKLFVGSIGSGKK